MESITERLRGKERGARSVNNHLNKLENSSRTEDVNTHIEKVHCMSNKIIFKHTHTHTSSYTAVKFKNNKDNEKILKASRGRRKA